MRSAATFASPLNPADRRDGLECGTGAARFRVCDLVIESSVPLPELAAASETTFDCRFQVFPAGRGFGSDILWIRQWSTPEDGVWLRLGMRGEDYLLRFPEYGDFLISRDATAVGCCPLPETPPTTVRHLFLDQVIPLLLSRRECIVLHASAVLTPRGAIAFVGRSGQGKSTLAACFAQAGCPLISDDYLVLRQKGKEWTAIPSYPGVRLWPQASDGIFSSFPVSLEIAHYTEKRRVSDPALVPFAQSPHPLRSLYFLDGENGAGEPFQTSAFIASAEPRDAFMRLIACAFNLDIRDKVWLRNQFDAIGQLRTQLPCFRLRYARDFSILPEVRQAIVDQPAAGGQTGNAL